MRDVMFKRGRNEYAVYQELVMKENEQQLIFLERNSANLDWGEL